VRDQRLAGLRRGTLRAEVIERTSRRSANDSHMDLTFESEERYLLRYGSISWNGNNLSMVVLGPHCHGRSVQLEIELWY